MPRSLPVLLILAMFATVVRAQAPDRLSQLPT
jgi:hypothetical protein